MSLTNEITTKLQAVNWLKLPNKVITWQESKLKVMIWNWWLRGHGTLLLLRGGPTTNDHRDIGRFQGKFGTHGRKWSFFKVKFKATFFHKDDLKGVNIDSMDSNIAAVSASAAPWELLAYMTVILATICICYLTCDRDTVGRVTCDTVTGTR